MPIATDATLLKHRADILNHGVVSWVTQLAMAEADVIERVKTEWWVNAVKTTYGGAFRETKDYSYLFPAFDSTKLNTSALANLVCYRAMAYYIYPSLTRDTDDGADAFSRRAERYHNFYSGEWDRVVRMALYDFDSDTQFADIERSSVPRTVRVYRA